MKYIKNFKRNSLFLLIMLLSFFFVGCDNGGEKETETVPEKIEFSIYAINDFHGAVIDSDTGGFSTIGNYLIEEKEKNKDKTLIISSGDMFQGSAISNMTNGGVVVSIMNEIGFDSMTIGNHEFDWGVDVIKNYNSKTSEVKANFPLICSNIYELSTNQPVDWCEPYTVVEKSGVKIGIIGVIGSDLTSSIATSIISPYRFANVLDSVKKYAKILRQDEGCNIVIVSAHADTIDLNQIFADLTGDEAVDAVLNGHTHTEYSGETLGSDNAYLPYVQSGSSGSYVGKIVLEYNTKTKTVISKGAMNIRVSTRLSSKNAKIDEIIATFNEEVSAISDRALGVAGTTINRYDAVRWAVNVIQEYSGKDIGFINGGGIRASAFPIEKGEEVNVGRLWEMMPFDNFVKTCTMTASEIIRATTMYDVYYSDNIEVVGSMLFVNGKVAAPDDEFTIAAVDYIFDKTNFPFINGKNPSSTGDLFRDYLIQAVSDSCKDGKEWYAN